MKKYGLWSLFLICAVLGILDASLSEGMQVGLIAFVATLVNFGLEWKSSDVKPSSLFGYSAFAIIALGHLGYLPFSLFEMAEETYLTAVILVASICISFSFRDAVS